jgi:plastocyanin
VFTQVSGTAQANLQNVHPFGQEPSTDVPNTSVRMRMTVVVLVLVSALAPGARAGSAAVDVSNFAFTPSTAAVDVGDSVIWHWTSGFHGVVEDVDGEAWCSNRGAGSPDCSRTFPEAGTFAYHCPIHSSMHGSVVVEDPNAPDLLVSALAVSEDSTTIDVSVLNAGVNESGPSVLRVTYESSVFAPRVIQDVDVPSLPGGSVASFRIDWSTTGKIGDFTITATADFAGAISELDETNNSRQAPTSVLVAGVPGVPLIP